MVTMTGTAPDEVIDAFKRCRECFPAIGLPFEAFRARVAEVISSGDAPPGATIQYEDLFLTTACARADRIAWEYFVEKYLPAIKGFAGKACRNFHEAEELSQQFITGLMEDGTRLGSFNGRCSLAGWLRVAVAHAAIDRFRRTSRTVSLEELQDNGRAVAPCSDQRAGGEQADARWGPVLWAVLSEQIRKLPARDRLLLTLYYVQSVSLKLIGSHFRVHESTASRWLESLRRTLQKAVERELRTRYGLKRSEVQSLWVWASDVGAFSLEQALGSPPVQGSRTSCGGRDLRRSNSSEGAN